MLPRDRALAALKVNPEKSDRAIAKELGVSQPTVSRARRTIATDVSAEPAKRIGLDGKARKLPKRKAETGKGSSANSSNATRDAGNAKPTRKQAQETPETSAPPIKRPPHRPSTYTTEIANHVVERVMQGNTIPEICAENPDLPAAGTIYRWLNERPDFHEAYSRARKSRAPAFADRGLSRLKDETRDIVHQVMPNGSTRLVVNHSAVKRDEAIAGYYKWMASVDDPQSYGPKQQVEISVQLDLSGRLDNAIKRLELGPPIDVTPPTQHVTHQLSPPAPQEAASPERLGIESRELRASLGSQEPQPEAPRVNKAEIDNAWYERWKARNPHTD